MRLAFRNCPICDGSQVSVLHTQRFALPEGHPLSNGYDIVSCERCRFVYADTKVTQTDYDRYYARYSKYGDPQTGTGGTRDPFDWQRQQGTARQIDKFLDNRQASILDVGCANGGLLKALYDLGYQNLIGIDPSPVCVQHTRELGLEAHIGSLSSHFGATGFDCVILSHVLEHIQDIKPAVYWIQTRLNTHGVIYLETPDASRYIDLIYAPFQDFNTEHINHFSSESLDNLMCLCGFTLAEGGKKTLKTGINVYYPAVYGFWKRASITDPAIVKDTELTEKIKQYIDHSQRVLNKIDARIAQVLTRSPKLIVWGTGQLAMKLLIETSLAKATIVAFVDNNPINHGKTLHGRPILSPEQILNFDTPILIATLLHQQAIADQIRSMGLQNEIIFIGEKI